MRRGSMFKHYRYPQYSWASAIRPVLGEYLNADTKVIDGPCGDGLISHWLQKSYPRQKFVLVDQNSARINIARSVMSLSNAEFYRGDLPQYLVNLQGMDNVLLFINSISDIREIDSMMEVSKKKVKCIIGIFPKLESKNFRFFSEKYPDYPQLRLLDHAQVVDFFDHYGFILKRQESVSRIHHHAWPMPVTMRPIFSFMEKLVPKTKGGGAYWLGVFENQFLID